MKSFGQFCPLAQASQILCERWTLLIIREFIAGSHTFSDLHKGVPLMSPTLLSTRLKQLVDAGVIDKSSKKGEKKYQLTKAGEELRPIVEYMGAWGHRWVQSNLASEDISASLLMWDMRRSIDPNVFPLSRVVVQFNFPDAPSGGQDWWLISEDGEIDLCLNDKGLDVDIFIQGSIVEMTSVWICKTKFNDSIRNGKLKVSGDPKLTKHLQKWIKTSQLSELGERENLPKFQW